MSDAAADVSVVENPDAARYEASVSDALAGTCEYELSGRVVTFTHTVVSPEFEGRGVGSALARRVLDDARARGQSVVPACSFIAAYIRRHPEYAGLVSKG